LDSCSSGEGKLDRRSRISPEDSLTKRRRRRRRRKRRRRKRKRRNFEKKKFGRPGESFAGDPVDRWRHLEVHQRF